MDDEIYAEFVTKVPAGVHVVALIDCCHSGTAMDLPYVCNVGDGEIRRDEGFKMPITGMELVPKKDKDKKKKKKSADSKKKGKKKVKEPEPESEEEDEEEEEEEEPEPAPEPKKKKKGLFGLGKKKK